MSSWLPHLHLFLLLAHLLLFKCDLQLTENIIFNERVTFLAGYIFESFIINFKEMSWLSHFGLNQKLSSNWGVPLSEAQLSPEGNGLWTQLLLGAERKPSYGFCSAHSGSPETTLYESQLSK